MVIEHVSAVAVFSDLHAVPKVLIARRNNGTYTLPGGKQETESAYHAGVRELWEETRLTLLPNTRLRRMRKSVIFPAEDREIHFSLFYAWVGKSIPDNYMIEWTEREKTEPWRWHTLSVLRKLADTGLFPEPACRLVVSAAKRTGIAWVGDMTAYEYDFPHGGLHSLRSLRKTLSH
jgi:8-oxo-dGTP pyrophosphatase MutT (NUDIX family)